MIKAVIATLLVGVLFAGGCSGTLEPAQFEGGAPLFEPDRFFEGHVRSWGVFENRSGEPTRRFTTDISGSRDGDALVLRQDFAFEDGTTQQRVWRLRRIDAHRYEATANDVVGIATGEAWGNAFRWSYTLATEPGNPLKNVELSQWMYGVRDGSLMVNRATISKLGIILAEATEFFERVP